jgi:hypothetical protein
VFFIWDRTDFGNAAIPFVIPQDAAIGNQSVMVSIENTAINVDCGSVAISEPPPEEAIQSLIVKVQSLGLPKGVGEQPRVQASSCVSIAE